MLRRETDEEQKNEDNTEQKMDMSEKEAEQWGEQKQQFVDSFSENNIIARAHNNEVEAYRLLKLQSDSIRIPHCYYSHPMLSADAPGVLVLENLLERGVARTLANPLTIDSVLQVVESIASLHAWSLTHRDEWQANPKLKTSFATVARQIGFGQFLAMIDRTTEMYLVEFPQVFDTIIQRCRNAGVLFGYDEKGLEELLERPERLNAELGMVDVLVHGDLWISNMMFEKDAEGRATDKLLSIIDWQVSHPGCFAEDMVRLLLSSCTAEVRRQNTDRVIRHYLDTLTQLLGHDPPFTFDQLTLAYKMCFQFGSYNVFSMLPIFAKNKDDQLFGENVDEKRNELLERTKAIFEDCMVIEKELSNMKKA